MSHTLFDPGDIHTSTYIITHVFYPLQLPGTGDHSIHNDYSLAKAVATAAHLYSDHFGEANISQWNKLSCMLENLAAIVQSKNLDGFQIISRLSSMDIGDILALPIRAQNAGVVFRKQKDTTIFESFELSPVAKDVMTTQGKLICSYPGPAIEVPNNVFDDKNFLSELVNFLVHMNEDDLDAASKSPAFKGTAHPRYITELLTGILRSVGRPANITRISKHVGDDVVSNNSESLPWRRSSLWLLIRVTLQMTLGRSSLGHCTYKEFMLFFMCCFVEERICANLSNDLLHWMSAKISRRLRKLGSSAPEWLSGTVLEACTFVRSIMESRWKQVQAAQRVSPIWTPFQLDLSQDARLSLLSSGKYIRDSFSDYSACHTINSFAPNHPPRGSLHDFLNSDGDFFEEAYCIEPHITLYDVERAVEQGIGNWVDRVTNNNKACIQLVSLAHKYLSSALETYTGNPEHLSIMLLTIIELWIAADKVAVKEIAMLADYSPDFPTSLLDDLLLRKAVSLHRLRLAHEYLSHRRFWSRSQQSFISMRTITGCFTGYSYQISEYPQLLKTRIEKAARVREYYTYTLPSGPYDNLQTYVDSTFHTSNEVVANQGGCHEKLPIREYMAFGHLRSGSSLQWLNILRELRARSLSSRRPEVHMLLAQAVTQVGPFGSTGLIWHQEITQPAFCYVLLAELRGLIHDVEANWKEAVTMDTISLLLRRLLVSSPDKAVSQEVLSLLRTVRCKVFSWVQELLIQFAMVPEDNESRMVLPDTAAICRSTFDVDLSMIPKVLRSTEDIEILLACAMIIYDHMPSQASHLPAYSRLLLDRDCRLSLALEDVISDIIQADSSGEGINNAIRRVWSNYYPGSKWTQLKASNSCWFLSTTAPPAGQRPQTVHFNVLDGSLFVDGKPLGTWLPDEYVRHPLFKLILGKQMLKVTQSDLPGMDYSTRGVISDHQVSLSLRNDSDLVIRAKRKRMDAGDSDIIQLIPHEKLVGDLPTAFIKGHAHWLNLSTLIVEIRPLDTLWEPSPGNWRIDCTPGKYRMWKGNQCLIDIRSRSWHIVSSLFLPLGAPQDFIVTVSPLESGRSTSLQLSVILPRYDLSFYVDEDGDLRSRNIRGMVYDEDQSIGTLFGLVNRLVLRPKTGDVNAVELVPRCVIIPDGDVSFRINGHHVCVEITSPSSSVEKIAYQTYRVNTDLGCLTGNSTLTSKLYCAYLHALTSGCTTDPLMGRSGTEEALSVLLSASCCSNVGLSPRDAGLLESIASICTWDLASESVRQVKMPSLPAYSQNCGLYFLSKTIKECYKRAQVIYAKQSSPSFATFPSDEARLKRRAQRVAYLFPSESSRQSESNSDVRYPARDRVGIGEHRAYVAATCAYRRTATSTKDIWKMMESWRGVYMPTKLSLRYDRSWLAPDLSLIWLKMYNLLCERDERKWFQLLFSLPAMAYGSPNLSDLVPILVTFASHLQFSRLEDPPHYDSYPISVGYHPSLKTLHGYVVESAYPFERGPEWLERANDDDALRERQLKMYDNRRRSDADATAQKLLAAWPCETPPSCSLSPSLYDVAKLVSNLEHYFSDCFRNFKLYGHVARIQKLLDGLHSTALPHADASPYSFQPSQGTHSRAPWQLLVDQLFARPAPALPACDRLPRYVTVTGSMDGLPSDRAGIRAPLYRLISVAEANAGNNFQRKYISALRSSAESFGNEPTTHRTTTLPTPETLVVHYTKCRASYIEALHHLQWYLGPRTPSEQAAEQGGQWPRITAHTLFRSLASNSPTTLPGDWKRCLIELVLLALQLQHARRLILLYSSNNHEEFCRELQNEGCDGWNAEEHPDWLLIQLQGNFLIRRVQAEVAGEMILPRSGGNTAMQLDMGEGKSSVIVPIVAAALANGEQLVRVIVPKPLTAQTLHVLADRLGGLTNRRIYHLPFSRSLGADHEKITSVRRIVLECMRERGILVLQPEHILSLKLVSVENQLPDSQSTRSLLNLQKWLHSHSRDILDEIDEILDVRFQLVFTIGHQRHVEGYPERWSTIQQVLGLVSKYAPSLRKQFPDAVECEPGSPGSFPYLRILQEDASRELALLIAQGIMDGVLPNFDFAQLSSSLRDAIRSFISCRDVPPAVVQKVKGYSKRAPLWGGLLLLRGLLAYGILSFAFRERRWRVDYGLFPTRTMLAVPYRAKDAPALRADFGHTDVAIILTCLSYYYAGLDEEQLRQCFEILLHQQDPSSEYRVWVGDYSGVPEFLWTFTGINIESVEQWNKYVFPLFSRNRATVDFYLMRVVFPREIKEFPSKLSCSGWDLAEKRYRLLTGFSGTNDGQYLLPLPITQHDPNHQRGTNAKVLSYLLRPGNKHYICVAQENGERLSTRGFLKVLITQKPEIRVLLDVGAQMLDLQNHEVAKAWLEVAPSASAAIYFNEDDELTVRTRAGGTQLLRSSPFAQQLDQCIIYLDDAHTRGTDIKFPSGFRAAVTLGPKVTKDRLVQGCMRMRMLGHGQSVTFFAPPEIDRCIRSVSRKGPSDVIDSMNILQWAIQQTWEYIGRWAPHWAIQGMDHASRYAAWTSFCDGQWTSQGLADKWLQPEAKRLEDLYVSGNDLDSSLLGSTEIRQRCADLGVVSLSSSRVDEEQEREIVYELAEELNVRPPSPRVTPAKHSISRGVVDFVRTGVVQTRTNFFRRRAFKPAFDTLSKTSAAAKSSIWSRSVLTTADFEKTVQISGGRDNYLRPVYWIISAKRGSNKLLVVLSPYEVAYLLPDIRSSKKVHLHLYTPRISKSMKSCDDLALYSIPTVPDSWAPPTPFVDQLNVFAGQLYLNDYKTYDRLCRFLCAHTWGRQDEDNIRIERGKFILPRNWRKNPQTESTSSSVNVALEALIHLRCKGADLGSTDMGKILYGRLLYRRDFDANSKPLACNDDRLRDGCDFKFNQCETL